MRRLRPVVLGSVCLALAGCGRATSGSADAPSTSADPTSPARTQPPSEPLEPALAAFRSGWMPLAATGVPDYAAKHPTADGRGVLIAILDSGIDPSVPGLTTTSTGAAKVIDLRDFSGEGRIALTPLKVRGDSVTVAGRVLGGFGRVRTFALSQTYYGGVLAEIPLGTPAAVDPQEPPGSDLNGNGSLSDTLPVIVAQVQGGWGVFIDSDGDGSLATERPVLDYGASGQVLRWSGGAGGDEAPLGVAVNVVEEDGRPVLDLVFDTSGHGTHVAGIAAGHRLYDVDGFDGVAPGARLLGLKIANNAHGGISVTGSMVRALAYAVAFAAERRLPLVVNLSFGVGNEFPRRARIDQLVDSVLAAHPDVVMVVSAGNDGPGRSTIGLPGSAARVITVGATFPMVFVDQPVGTPARPDPLAYFSSRGGVVPKPDLVAPGVAYSTVPRWSTGLERNAGTSMAAPHVAGLAARLLSSAESAGLPVDAATLKRALMVTARPSVEATFLDEGTGLPDLPSAWLWLEGHAADNTAASRPVRTVAVTWDGGDGPATATVPHPGGGIVTLTGNVPWLGHAPWVPPGDSVRLTADLGLANLSPGEAATGMVTGWTDDRSLGPVLRIVATVVRSLPAGTGLGAELRPATLAAGTSHHWFFEAEADRPLQVLVEGEGPRMLLTRLYEPGARPFRGTDELLAGPGDERAVYQVDAADVVGGRYQLVAVASPLAAAKARVTVRQAPFAMAAARDGDEVVVDLTNRSQEDATATPRVALVGMVRSDELAGTAKGPEGRLPLSMPGWGELLEVDVELPSGAWSRFTDFGVTVLDALGRVVAAAPLDYATGRVRIPLTAALRGARLEVVLSPAYADPDAPEPWLAVVTSRVYAASAVPLAPTSSGAATGRRTWPPGTTYATRYRMRPTSWPLEDGFHPLGMVMTETEGPTWTRTVDLSPGTAP